MTLTNYEILVWAQNLSSFDFDEYLPVKVNFYLKKNMALVLDKASELDKEREKIVLQYGKIKDDGAIEFENSEKELTANQEYTDLLTLAQDLDIIKIPLSNFENINMKTSQLTAIMPMIEEDK